MAYQNVGTPRFYVNLVEWFMQNGIGSADSVFRTLPVNPIIIETDPDLWYIDLSFINSGLTSQSFVAVLGHDIGIHGGHFTLGSVDAWVEIVNADIQQNRPFPEYDGFSIATFVGDGLPNVRLFVKDENDDWGVVKAGSIIIGTYYQMSHSPDLSLTLTREYSGIKTLETKGGASLSNDFGSSPPKWGTREAWQLGNEDFSVGGRRLWNLSFSFLSDSSVMPDNPTEIADAGGWEVDDTTPDFMSEVLKKTRGSQLPFIFQPNTDENLFAICKFDMKSFKFSQVSHKRYTIKIKVREVW